MVDTTERIYMPNNPGWVTSQFTKAQLQGKKIYFPHPPANEMVIGVMNVQENGAGQIWIDIAYGGPNTPGGQWTPDQAFVDKIQELGFLVPPADWFPPAPAAPTNLKISS
jgi:hypothetical protein